MTALDDVLAVELTTLRAAGLERELRRWTGRHGPTIRLDGRELVSFSSNNYLGLAGEPALARAASAALVTDGVGAGASRLIAGNHAQHEALESELAQFHGTESALLFNSGFQANLGIIPALVGAEDLILSDQLNHASLIDGARLSRARIEVYRHGDPSDAHRLLLAGRASARRALIITESVFSMDGDRAPVAELAAIGRDTDSWLMVDEAHAVGALGPSGRGVAASAGVAPELLVGTLGKAFGSFGAYVAGSKQLRNFLLHRARSFVFTTALPPSVVAASRAALALITGSVGAERRAALQNRIEHFATTLRAASLLAPGAGHSPIFPVVLGDERRTMAATASLLDAGFHVQGIRPPTVPRGTSRLRISLIATHATTDLDRLTAALLTVIG